MSKKKLQWSAFFAVFWILILSITLTTATYAWFTISAVTNVEPMDGAVSRGDANLLIAVNREGPFDKECQLLLSGSPQELQPLSTADLNHFYSAAAQSGGIVSLYRDASKQVDEKALHGILYLHSQYRDCDVYLKRTGLDFGVDGQILAAIRLGIKITTQEGVSVKIFRLDELGSTQGAASGVTIPSKGTVVSSVDQSGKAVYAADPSEDIEEYLAVEEGTDDPEPKAGRQKLCSLHADEVAEVEFWLYLEGCDENCINEVQQRDTGLQFAFAGVPREDQRADEL